MRSRWLSVANSVLGDGMELAMNSDSDIPYSDRDLVQRALAAARPNQGERDLPRWVLAKRVFSTGKTVSVLICTRYGFDPDKEVSAPPLLSETAYEENLLEHGIVL